MLCQIFAGRLYWAAVVASILSPLLPIMTPTYAEVFFEPLLSTATVADPLSRKGKERILPFAYSEFGRFENTTSQAMLTSMSDETIAWSTCLGGYKDSGMDVAFDEAGNIYVTGITSASTFPVTEGAYDTTYNGGLRDIFVAKFSKEGQLLWCTYIGGNDMDDGLGIAVTDEGVYVVGVTESTDFPVSNLTTYGGYYDAFICRLSPDGTNLEYSTFFGTSTLEQACDVVADETGHIFVALYTFSKVLPLVGPYAAGTDRSDDVYLMKQDGQGETLWSTYFGGSGFERPYDMEIDLDGNVYVGGVSSSVDWATGPYKGEGKQSDAFVAKFRNDGKPLWARAIGGSGYETTEELAVDRNQNVYIGGETESVDFPILGGAYGNISERRETMVARLSERGDLQWSTVLPGDDWDETYSIAVDDIPNVYVAGYTTSNDFPDPCPAPSYKKGDMFIAKFGQYGTHLDTIFWGGSSYEYPFGAVAKEPGNIVFIGDKLIGMGANNSADMPRADNTVKPYFA